MKQVIILRGLPGSGKSSLATHLIFGSPATEARICSADYFFIQSDGQYIWKQEQLGAAHGYCRERFMAALVGNVGLIIIDNTNTTKKEYCFYEEEAERAGYEVTVLIVGNFSDKALEKYQARNLHGVSLETLRRMRDRFTL